MLQWLGPSLSEVDPSSSLYDRKDIGPEMAYMIQCVIRPFKAVDCFIDFSQLKVILPLSQVYTNTIVLTVLRPFKVSSASLITVRFVISILSCRLTRFLYSTEYVTPPENCFCRPLLVNHGTFLP